MQSVRDTYYCLKQVWSCRYLMILSRDINLLSVVWKRIVKSENSSSSVDEKHWWRQTAQDTSVYIIPGGLWNCQGTSVIPDETMKNRQSRQVQFSYILSCIWCMVLFNAFLPRFGIWHPDIELYFCKRTVTPNDKHT